jgi:hypothetical protein
LKTLFLSSIVFVGLAAAAVAAVAAVAAPPLGASSRPETPPSLVVLVAQGTLPNSGEVSEAISVEGYTYLQVTKDGKETWLAIPRRDIPVGAQVRYVDGMVMKDFHSSSLNRTFEAVMFLERIEVAGESEAAVAPGQESVPTLPPGHEPVPTLPPGHSPVPAAPADLPNAGQVNEAIAAGNYTYLHVARDGKETWLAIPRRDIPVGARVRYAEGVPMKDFHSASLNRTFAEVLFLGDVVLADD